MSRTPATGGATVGPFFPPHFFGPFDHDLTRVRTDGPTARGERITISGRVFEANRVPRWNTIIELWQADANGCFAHASDPRHREADPNFMGWGRRSTGNDGAFDFITVKPGAYRDPLTDSLRAPHINVSIMGSGLMRRLVTTLFFANEPTNDRDPVFGAVPVARRKPLLLQQVSVTAYTIDIVLQGEDETPFFVD
jgi:protocatechuate 3,4-dioxygenase alpha subunit